MRCRPTSPTGPIAHRTLFGVNYDHNTWDFKLGLGAVNPGYALNILNPVYGIAGPTPGYTSGSRSTQEQVGVYLQDQMRLGNWHLSVSGRQDWTDRTQINSYTGAVTGARNDNAFSYSAGLLYHFENGIAPYVSYATSFQPETSLGLDGIVLAPSEGEQIEGGVKYQPRPDVLLTASIYDLKEKNAAKLAGCVNGIAYYASVGEIRAGLQFEARARLTPELETVTAYTYSDAEITRSSIATELGKTPAVTPKHTASSWMNYTFLNGSLEGLGLGAGVRYIDATWTSNDNTSRNNGYTLFDLAARYDFAKLGPRFAGLSGLDQRQQRRRRAGCGLQFRLLLFEPGTHGDRHAALSLVAVPQRAGPARRISAVRSCRRPIVRSPPSAARSQKHCSRPATGRGSATAPRRSGSPSRYRGAPAGCRPAEVDRSGPSSRPAPPRTVHSTPA